MTAIFSTTTHSGAQTPVEQPDKYQWLEDVNGERSLAWVRAENERTAKVLESDPRFAGLQADALKVLESPDRLPIPVFREGEIYNTWQDAEHVIEDRAAHHAQRLPHRPAALANRDRL